MNRNLFETFSYDKKKDVVFSYGEFIAKIRKKNIEYRLYRVYSFLVEVQMNKASKMVEIIQTIDEDKALNKFSDGIDLDRLLSE